MRVYGMDERLAFSRGKREATDVETLKYMIDGAVSVTKTDSKTDRAGIDYIVRLRDGARISVDAKARDAGASLYWKYGEPELALETWSVKPDPRNDTGVVGWTLNEAKEVNLILFTFDPSDTTDVYLTSFQLLRIAFLRNRKTWETIYSVKSQNSGKWVSECVFVPVSVVLSAISSTMKMEWYIPF